MLKVFVEFERDTVMFYEILIPFIDDDDTLVQLQRIIAEENKHIERLSQFAPDKETIAG
jgi:rubrerythrin